MKLILAAITIIALSFSCKPKNENTWGNNSEYIIIPYSTSDTILYANVKGSSVPIYLSIPSCDVGNLPAVVLLHGSGGMWKDNDISTGVMSRQNREWKEIFDSNCIIGAYIDSYTPRGCTERVGEWKEAPLAFKISSQFVRPFDAYEGLALLKRLIRPDGTLIVRSNDIGILGFSDGASALAATLYDTNVTPSDWVWYQNYDKKYSEMDGIGKPAERLNSGGFACGVFYYGGMDANSYWGGNPCNTEEYIYRNYAPLLFQIAENGYLAEKALCAYTILKETNMPVDKFIYPGATHGFDGNTGSQKDQSELARNNTIEWLRQYLHIAY